MALLFYLVFAAEPISAGATKTCSVAAHLDLAETHQVIAVTETGSLRIDGGQEVQLAGIEMPRPSWDTEQTVPMSSAARAALSDLVERQTIRLFVGAKGRDRYQRLLAHPCLDTGIWLQGWLLENGLARVATTREAAAMAREMLAIERRARARRVGIWSTRFFRMKPGATSTASRSSKGGSSAPPSSRAGPI
jgi:micrococcal nuclease